MQKENNPTLRIPTHVAIIMDGNRRWVNSKSLKETEGHKVSVERIKEIIAYCAKIGVRHVTFWAFSTENWKRNEEFLRNIFQLFRFILDKRKDFFDDLAGNGGEIHILGDLSRFPGDIVSKIEGYLELQKKGLMKKTIDVNFALNYGGRDELIRAFKKIMEKGYKSTEITPELVGQHLDTVGQPDVDLMIRTGGEIRTSGFLLWQLNYAEYYFSKTYFPDFGVGEFKLALEEFSRRNRRFGGDNKPPGSYPEPIRPDFQ